MADSSFRRVDVDLPDGRMLRAYDTGRPGDRRPALVWHHGSPQTGAPLPPVIAAAQSHGIRVFSYARPSYGGSSDRPGRDVASAADDTVAVADALGVEVFAAAGFSGGGPHALAVAALRGDRVSAVITFAGIAPHTSSYDWFAGMTSPDALHAAVAGRGARALFEQSAQFDPAQFLPVDFAALEDEWSSLGGDVAQSAAYGADGLIDDDMAFVSAWGFDVADVSAPVLIVQGDSDRIVPRAHGEWLAAHLPAAELRLRAGAGHVSVLEAVSTAFDWMLEH